MSKFAKLISARKAFQAIDLSDVLTPVNEEQRIELQKTVLDIYKDVLEFCHEYNLVPFLVGGSALGAVRHNGFIPWDDDLDIAFVRREYDFFIKEFDKRYTNKYIVNSAGRDSDAKTRFTKILKRGTICKELISPPNDSLNGVFIDVFPIDNVPDNSFHRFFKGHLCNIVEYISSQVSYFEFGDDDTFKVLKRMGRMNFYLRKFVSFIFGGFKSSVWFSFVDRIEQSKNDNSQYCTIAPGRKHYFGEIFARKTIFPPRYIDFCDIQAPVFHDVNTYLKNMYGDYMSIPPVEKREVHMIKELKLK